MTDATIDSGLRSWVTVADDSDFPIQNLPLGVFRTAADGRPHVGVAIGDQILDLAAVHESGVMRLPHAGMTTGSLNALLGYGIEPVRRRVSELLTKGNDELSRLPGRGLVDQAAVEMVLPVEIGDYVDFYSSRHHAENVGRMFRPDAEPLLPNWEHIPIGYHGRAGTVVVSGTQVERPDGQFLVDEGFPMFGPTRRLDFEMEVGFVTGRGSRLGSPIPIADAGDHIAGMVLVNDWSARDIQAWEYRPLGPFLGKSFTTSISPWLVAMVALEPFRVPAVAQDPEPLPYLMDPSSRGLDLRLQVEVNGTVVSRSGFRDMYWTMEQQLAHATSNGAAVRPGDLFASGTVSNADASSFGSMLELSWNGTRPVELLDGTTRTFLEDGDEVVMRGWCERGDGPRIGFGECRGKVVGGANRLDLRGPRRESRLAPGPRRIEGRR